MAGREASCPPVAGRQWTALRRPLGHLGLLLGPPAASCYHPPEAWDHLNVQHQPRDWKPGHRKPGIPRKAEGTACCPRPRLRITAEQSPGLGVRAPAQPPPAAEGPQELPTPAAPQNSGDFPGASGNLCRPILAGQSLSEGLKDGPLSEQSSSSKDRPTEPPPQKDSGARTDAATLPSLGWANPKSQQHPASL